MTLDEAKEIAKDILTDVTRSYSLPVRELAKYVINLVPGQNIIQIEDEDDDAMRDTLPPEPVQPFPPSPSLIPVDIEDDSDEV